MQLEWNEFCMAGCSKDRDNQKALEAVQSNKSNEMKKMKTKAYRKTSSTQTSMKKDFFKRDSLETGGAVAGTEISSRLRDDVGVLLAME